MAIKPPWNNTYTISVDDTDSTWADEPIPGLTIEEGFVKIGKKAFDAEQLGIMLAYLEELTREAKPEEFI